MKHLFSAGLALIIAVQVMELFPTTKAPELNQEIFQASILQDQQEEITSTFKSESSDKPLLLNLLELYVDKERDLTKATQTIDQTIPNEANQKILELYRAKISARSLDFQTAEMLLSQIDDAEIALLKAAVLIAKNDRSKSENYLHQLVEKNSDPHIRSAALSLLNVYKTYDTHRDAEESYLWVLFAQKLSELGEHEISLYLCEKTIEKNPEYRDAWLIKGYNEMTLKDFPNAETSLLSAYQLDPGNAQIQYLLGLTYFELQKPELSSQYLLYAQQNNADHQEIILEKLATNAQTQEDYLLAIHYYEQLFSYKKQAKILKQLIWIHAEKLNQFDKAIEYAQDLIDLEPETSSYELMSWIYSKQGDYEKANQYLLQSQQLP